MAHIKLPEHLPLTDKEKEWLSSTGIIEPPKKSLLERIKEKMKGK